MNKISIVYYTESCRCLKPQNNTNSTKSCLHFHLRYNVYINFMETNYVSFLFCNFTKYTFHETECKSLPWLKQYHTKCKIRPFMCQNDKRSEAYQNVSCLLSIKALTSFRLQGCWMSSSVCKYSITMLVITNNTDNKSS